MNGSIATLVLAIAPLFGFAQTQKPDAPEKVSADQLTALLAADAGQDDAHLAAELKSLQLTERMGAGRLARLNAPLPGEKSREALLILVDSATLLEPAQADVVANPVPDAAALRQMLVQVVLYVNTTLHQLPNFLATRSTTAFEDQPQEDVLDATGIVGHSYLPLHLVGRASAEVAFRDGHEVTGKEKKTADRGSGVHGLATAGEFGPFLSTVVADALRGKITWLRWEQSADGVQAVFHYEVPQDKSHYVVQFCCTREQANQSIVLTHVYHQVSAYHGEIAFSPDTGAIRRITVEANLARGDLVEKAAMMVEYGTVQIAGKSVILPTKSVSLLAAHASPAPQGMHMASDRGPLKNFLNDTQFENYHEFRGEMRIVNDGGAAPKQ